MNMVRDEPRSMTAESSKFDKNDVNMAEIEEVVSSTDELLDEFIVKINEAKSKKGRGQEDFSHMETDSNTSGKQILRNPHTNRQSVETMRQEAQEALH